MSQNLKDKLAAFIAMGVNPESEALVTALVNEVCELQASNESIGQMYDEVVKKMCDLAATTETNSELAAGAKSIADNLKSVITEAHDVATTASTLSNDAANKVASHEQRLAQVERFAQPLLGVVEPEQTPPAQ